MENTLENAYEFLSELSDAAPKMSLPEALVAYATSVRPVVVLPSDVNGYDRHLDATIECTGCDYRHSRRHRVYVPINSTMKESRCPMCQSAQFYNEPKSDNELFAAKRRIKELESEAAPIRAELERVRWEKELVMRQLSAANQRIAEMEKQIESNKKALASNGTISGTGTARSSARTNSLRSMYSKRLPVN
jgi:hypothetical protein